MIELPTCYTDSSKALVNGQPCRGGLFGDVTALVFHAPVTNSQ